MIQKNLLKRSLEIFFDFYNEELPEIISRVENETDADVIWRSVPAVVNGIDTNSAHILSKWADENNVGLDYRKMILYNVINEKNISMIEVLEEIIDKLGFDEVKIEKVLKDEKYITEVQQDLKRYAELSIINVPFSKYN